MTVLVDCVCGSTPRVSRMKDSPWLRYVACDACGISTEGHRSDRLMKQDWSDLKSANINAQRYADELLKARIRYLEGTKDDAISTEQNGDEG